MVADLLSGPIVVLGQGPLSTGVCDLLADDGVEVALLPTTEIVIDDDPQPLLDELERLDGVAWIAVTSAAAAVPLGNALAGRQRPTTLRVAAVGPATAAALEDAGVTVDLVGEGHGGAALGELLGPAELDEARVVLPRSSIARTEIDAVLAAHGYVVRPVVVYATRTVALDDEAIGLLASATCVVAAAPSALASLLDAGLVPARVAAIGATTAAAARAAGTPIVAVAPTPTAAGLRAAVDVAFRASGDGA